MFIAPGSTTAADKASATKQPLLPIGNLGPFFLVTSLFFLWAIPNNLNDILIRQFMKSFALTRFEGGLVQSAFYMGYFLLAIPAALLMRRAGYKAGILTGLLLFATGTFLFYPAALVGQYWFFLFALFVMASGLAFLETAANPFIAQIGAPESSERRLNFSQAFNPIGAIAGAGVGTVFILSGVELTKSEVAARIASGTYAAYLRTETLRVVAPYALLGLIALILAGVIARTKFPVIQSEHEGDVDDHAHVTDLLHQRHFVLAVITQFLYIGAQVGTWSYFIQYVQDYTHQPEKVAGYFLIGTLAAFGVGRFGSAWLMQFVPASRLMAGYAIANIVLLTIAIVHPGWVGLWCVFGTSLCMSVMFPTLFALGIKDLGANTKIAGSLLVMSIVGGAILTPIMGLIAEHTGSIADAYIIPLISYIAVVLYALFGSKPSYSR
ncbi:L-fucose:H+ symporter permease [Granulicella arctica]|uniref:L-fucose:H+ symporter permease n=1 Tax=Granulicella arctica TaxID=940613 RepID=UPI0021DF4E94|nr:L-fucose:H+ symporter permease [Granulicella arctica]